MPIKSFAFFTWCGIMILFSHPHVAFHCIPPFAIERWKNVVQYCQNIFAAKLNTLDLKLMKRESLFAVCIILILCRSMAANWLFLLPAKKYHINKTKPAHSTQMNDSKNDAFQKGWNRIWYLWTRMFSVIMWFCVHLIRIVVVFFFFFCLFLSNQ